MTRLELSEVIQWLLTIKMIVVFLWGRYQIHKEKQHDNSTIHH